MADNQKVYSNKKILLHACCAICSAYPISALKDMGYTVIVYFYNPNIYPSSEYQKRLAAQKKLCDYYNCELIIGDYEPETYYNFVKGYETEPEKGSRCDKCFELRLKKTAAKAKSLGIEEFTTSIVISPHKNYEKLTEIGQNIATLNDLNYKAINFRKKDGFLKTNTISKELNLYRQNYCGCKFAIKTD
ncbi:MAG: epoxyqueuosine reductase QueH [Cyanobacteria bacterium SIG26]|nr:epoxyqueuosine reductase QueH [Cyanobacteria bacterium SIG26]